MDDGLDDLRADVANFAASVKELLKWEFELSGSGIPDIRDTDDRIDAPAAHKATSGATVNALQAIDPAGRLRVLAQEAASCEGCGLYSGRNKSVFARGVATADLMFVGEGPGAHEDEQGVPFVGRAGELLDKMIGAMGFTQDEIYICNVVKCRPPDNRTPTSEEAAACSGYLSQQIELVRPKVIVALGRCAAENLGLATPGEGGWRGRWGKVQEIPSVATYHPAYLLRSPEQKKPVWSDLKQVVAHLGRALPRR